MVLREITRKYFTSYLKDNCGFSDCTIVSYKTTMVQLIIYMEQVAGIMRDDIKVEDFTFARLNGFLDWLETERKVSISTRNNRLASLKTFFRYASHLCPEHLDVYHAVHAIKAKKMPQPVISYLTKAAVIFLMESIDSRDKVGLRDLAIIVLLYESAARVSELIGIRRNSLNLGEKAQVTLTGKGNKTRILPINAKVAALLKRYTNAYNIQDDEFLFFNKKREKLTRQGVAYILEKHISKAREAEANLFPTTFSPHCMRHSKAMHLLESGVQLYEIRDFLGHVSIMTTEIYARANPELKRRYLKEYTDKLNTADDFSEEQKETLEEWLTGAKHD